MSGTGPGAELLPAGFFVLRTPLLPFDEITAWGDGDGEGGDGGDGPGGAARLGLQRRLLAALARPVVRDALFLASPRVEEALSAILAEPDAGAPSGIEPVLVAYLLRAATRPMPFGLFAGWTTGVIGAETDLELPARRHYRRHTRLDMDYLDALAGEVEADPELRRDLLFRPNSSLYEAAGRLHLAEAGTDGGRRAHHLVAYDQNPHLAATLERAGGGERLDALAQALVGGDVTEEAAGAFVADLVGAQILVSEARPAVTGDGSGPVLQAALGAAPASAALARELAGVHAALAVLDDTGLYASPAQYRQVAGLLGRLPGRADLDRLVQADLEKPAPAVLGAEVVAEILRGVHLLQRLASPPAIDALARFRDRFAARYGTRQVPLLEALDEEAGVGFEAPDSPAAEGGPLLASLRFPPAEEEERWTAADTLRLRLLARALAAGATEVCLTPGELESLPAPAGPLPDALYALAAVAAPSPAEINAGRFRVHLDHAAGPSGAILLGRFCSADARLRRFVEDHLRAEEAMRPDAVHAEIVHLPEGRTGNILQRPVLRSHEIPYLGPSGAPMDRQLPVTDLMVSAEDDRVVLRSQRLGREVLPRLSSAHDYHRFGLPLYRFLCSLQDQGVAADVAWDWGPLRHAPFLPRVVSGRLVLARARWNLGAGDLAAFRGATSDGPGPFAAWRRERRLPRYVTLLDDDRQLAVDLENPLAVEALAHQLRGRSTGALAELFPAPDELWVSGPEGRFVHELVVPFGRRAVPSPPGPPPGAAPTGAVRRRFPPGSEWLYAKLYTGPATADRVLAETIGPLAAGLVAAGAAERWFFLRYADPEPHLRVRFRGSPSRLHEEVLPALEAAAADLTERGHVWRLQLDTYEREVERYGGPAGIGLAEDLFAADSAATVAVLSRLTGDAGLQDRWRIALRGIDQLFIALGLSPAERRAVAADSARAYGEEFGIDGVFRRAVSRRFRHERPLLETLVGASGGLPPALAEVVAAFDERWAPARPAAAELARRARRGRLGLPLVDVAASLAHLHVNRMLRAAQRAQELVLYEFLERLYAAQAARREPDR